MKTFFNYIFLFASNEKSKKLCLLITSISCNIFAALSEGISITLIFFALTAASNSASINDYMPFFLKNLKDTTWINFIFYNFKAFNAFLFFIIIAILFQFVRAGAALIGKYCLELIRIDVQTATEYKIYSQFLKFKFPFINKFKIGDLADYIQSPRSCFFSLGRSFHLIFQSFFIGLVLISIMLFISTKLTFCIFAFYSLIFLIQKKLIIKLKNYSKANADKIAEYSKQSMQNLNGIRLIYTFQKQNSALAQIKTILNNIKTNNKKVAFLDLFIYFFNETSGIILVAIALTSGFFILKNEKIFLELILTFLGASYRLAGKLQDFFYNISLIACHFGSINRIYKLLRIKDEDEKNGTIQIDKFNKLSFHNLHLKYPNTPYSALKDLSFNIDKGETIAFVGTSGAGKSSIIDLIIRLYLPTKGQIKVNDIDLNELEMTNWRNHLGVVSQETFVFNDSIKNNLLFANPNSSHEDILKASKMAFAHDFILKLPNGYDTIIGEKGYKLSGGEKQRLSIARALIKKPSIIIFDEATNNLDSQTEKYIQNTISTLQSTNQTLIIITHRLPSIQNADKIIFIKNGQLSGVGNHHQLLKDNKFYFSLWKSSINHEDIANVY